MLNQTEKRKAMVQQVYSDELGPKKTGDGASNASSRAAARLINRKLSFVDSRNQKNEQHKSITFEKDDVAPRGGKDTIEVI